MKRQLILAVLLSGLCLALTLDPGKDPVLSVPEHFPSIPESVRESVTAEGIELGRFLFYDSILSLKRDRACASCHRQEFAFSEGPLRTSALTKDAPVQRNTPALFNLAWGTAFFWDGRAATLRDQVFEVVRSDHEMQLDWKTAEKRIRSSRFYRNLFRKAYGKQEIDSNLIAGAIAQFGFSLLSSGSKYDRVLEGKAYFSEDEYRGFVLANEQMKGDCLHCHPTDGNALGTTGAMSNNGLDGTQQLLVATDAGRFRFTGNGKDRGVFKVPSLRNLLYTAPYMHDGRFATLGEVVAFYSSGVQHSTTVDPKMQHAKKGGVHLTEEEQRQIVAFLRTLSDSVFVNDPRYTNPFY